jgi:hypothetical protein
MRPKAGDTLVLAQVETDLGGEVVRIVARAAGGTWIFTADYCGRIQTTYTPAPPDVQPAQP